MKSRASLVVMPSRPRPTSVISREMWKSYVDLRYVVNQLERRLPGYRATLIEQERQILADLRAGAAIEDSGQVAWTLSTVDDD